MSETIFPGFVELHDHLREPGMEEAETIATGTAAAAYGGYAAVWDMPNNIGHKTLTVVKFDEKVNIAEREIYTQLGIHAGYIPEESHPDDFGRLMTVTDSVKWYMGDTTGNSKKYSAAEYRSAAKIVAEVNPEAVVFLHSHPDTLDETLHMTTQEFGLATHVCHVTADNLPIIAKYKKRGGARLTSEVTPHHILMSEHDVLRMGWGARMMPKLQKAPDADRLLYALSHKEVEAVATDHAPHPDEKKITAEVNNPTGRIDDDCDTCFGVPSSEFAFGLMRNLVRKGKIPEDRLIDAFTTAPASIMGVSIHPKSTATFTDEVYEIQQSDIKSKCGRSPYVGSVAVGRLTQLTIKGYPHIKPDGSLVHVARFGPLRRGAVV